MKKFVNNYLYIFRDPFKGIPKFLITCFIVACVAQNATAQSCPTGKPDDPFTAIDQAYSVSTSGHYSFNISGQTFSADVDTSDGGGWVLILQYIHKAGTSPDLNVFPSGSLPLYSNVPLGTDGSINTLSKWGHVSNNFLNSISGYDELRFYGESSGHNRIINFKTNLGIDYIKSGTGSFSSLQNNFTPLTGHTSYIPEYMTSVHSNQGDKALTGFPFYRGGQNHWGIGRYDRWEVDDYARNTANTIHRVWIRSSTANVCNISITPNNPMLSCTELSDCFNYTNNIGTNGYHFGNQKLLATGTNPNYALLHEDDGTTHINAAGNKPIILSHNQNLAAVKLDYNHTNIYNHLYVTKGNPDPHDSATKNHNKVLVGAVAHFDGRVYLSEDDSLYTDDNDTEAGIDLSLDLYKRSTLVAEKGIVSHDFAMSNVEFFPDYVFDDNYHLMQISDLKEFIKINKHLPNFLKGDEIEKNGFEFKDMTLRIVKTIEELTLYKIEQQKEIKQQQEKLDLLSNKLKELENNKFNL